MGGLYLLYIEVKGCWPRVDEVAPRDAEVGRDV